MITFDALSNSESIEMHSCSFFSEQLPHLVLSIILAFHMLTGCDTMQPLSGKGKNICLTMFIKYAHLLTGVVRGDSVNGASVFVCPFYGI